MFLINAFVMRKWAGLIIPQLLSVVLFVIGDIYYGVWGGVSFFLVALVLGLFLGFILLKNPFSDMVEGRGIMVFDFTSTGVIRPFLVRLQNPFVVGKFNGKFIKDIFNREAVASLAPPVVSKATVSTKSSGGLSIDIDEKEYNENRFALFHYPVLIWNSNINSFLTKEWFSELEKTIFAEHTVLYLNRNLEDLTSAVRDFGRHIVDTLKPSESFFSNKWVWIIIFIAIIVVLAMFAPSILNTLKGVGSTVGGAVGTAGGAVAGAPITPR